MTEATDSLIASQQLEIAEQKDHILRCEKALNLIQMRITCIGGPLNDNCGQYNFDQRKIFHKFIEDIEWSRI